MGGRDEEWVADGQPTRGCALYIYTASCAPVGIMIAASLRKAASCSGGGSYWSQRW